jgi:hypothetical protein
MSTAPQITMDTLVQIFAFVATIISIHMAFRRFRAKNNLSGGFWLLGAGAWAAVAIFMMTFHVRLM